MFLARALHNVSKKLILLDLLLFLSQISYVRFVILNAPIDPAFPGLLNATVLCLSRRLSSRHARPGAVSCI